MIAQARFLIVALIAALLAVVQGCTSTNSSSSCTLTPEETEGPYYSKEQLLQLFRQNITEGRPGIPLKLVLTVYDNTTCSPIENAMIDIWHCDADGFYSDFVSQVTSDNLNDESLRPEDDGTFLRGLTLTNSSGVGVFDTIYPGWYAGRATHIHIKVHNNVTVMNNGTQNFYTGGVVSHTGQLFFNDTLSDQVGLVYPYSAHNLTRTRLDEDSIYTDTGGNYTLTSITYTGSNLTDGMIGSIKLIVYPNANATAVSNGGGAAANITVVGSNGTMPSGGMPSGAMPSGTMPSMSA